MTAPPSADQPADHIGEVDEMVDLAELKRLAEAATPGPWDEVHNMAGPMMVKGGKDRSYVCHLAMNRHEHDNAAYIAAANPAAVLSLLDLIARQQETIWAMEEAVTPSGATKAAYHGEFKFQVPAWRENEDEEAEDEWEEYLSDVTVPWTTVKEIMAAVAARARLTARQPKEPK